MKVFLFFTLALLLYCRVNAQSTFEVNGIVYQEDLSQKEKMVVCVVPKRSNSPVDIAYKSDYVGDIVIPITIDYDLDIYEVTGIAQFAFNASEELENLVIEANIKTMLPWTISNCQSLESIKLPNSIENIQMSAIAATPSLKSIELGKGLKTIDDGNFSVTSITEINIPDSVISIGNSFLGCSKLTTVRFGGGIKELAKSAFTNCPLKEVYFTQESPLISRPGFLDYPCTLNEDSKKGNRRIRKMAYYTIIKVPTGCKENYEKAWGAGLNIVEE